MLEALGALLGKLKAQILELARRINTWHRSNETSRRLDDLPGVGPALKTALVASVADPKCVPIGPGLLGLDRPELPEPKLEPGQREARQHHQAGRSLLYRPLFTAGALAVIRYAKIHGTTHRPWLAKLLERRPTKVAAIALANKIAAHGLGDDGGGRVRREPIALANRAKRRATRSRRVTRSWLERAEST